MVRSIVPGEIGPTGGPAFTDVLGVLEAWADGVLSIRTETGQVVSIPADLVVSGKPVPPRPSRFSRMTIEEVEQRCTAAVPRAESRDLDDRHIRVVTGSAAEADLIAEGWQPLDAQPAQGEVHLAGVAALCRELHEVAIDEIEYETGLGDDAVFASVHRDGRQIARARVDIADSWGFLSDLSVQPDHRRQGLARTVIAGVVEWSAERGASVLAVQVDADDEATLALCGGLGFERHHSFRYLVAPS